MIYAGAASAVITPPLGLTIQAATHENRATRVRDELEANVLYLKQDDVRIVLASCDVVCLEPDEDARLRAAAAAGAGLSPDDIILACTHTHGGPVMMPSNRYNAPDPAYHAALEAKLVDAVKRAVESAAPAKIGWGQGSARLSYNRRLCFADGAHTMHGDTRRADFTGIEGPVDNTHTGLFVKTLQDAPLAVLHANTSHPTTFYGCDCFSADFPGQARDLIRKALKPDLPVLFINGAQGNASNENMEAPKPFGETRDQKVLRLACLAAGETLRLYYEAEFEPATQLAHVHSELEVAVKLPTPERLAWSKKRLAEADLVRQTKTFDVLFAHGIDLLQARFGAAPSDRLPLHAIRVGGLAWATLPGEFYCDFGLDIRRRSPAPATAIIGIANGSHGYVPTVQGIIGGGYSGEPIYWTRFTAEAGYRVVDEACRLLRQLGF